MEVYVYGTLGVILLYGVIAQLLDSYSSYTHDEAWLWPLWFLLALVCWLVISVITVHAVVVIVYSTGATWYHRITLRLSLWRQKRAYLKRSYKVEM
ncbi:hypothetical protein [Xanthomonas phage RTH11]|nr:hypothetical protein [Xanthomonas phage RTH11]